MEYFDISFNLYDLQRYAWMVRFINMFSTWMVNAVDYLTMSFSKCVAMMNFN